MSHAPDRPYTYVNTAGGTRSVEWTPGEGEPPKYRLFVHRMYVRDDLPEPEKAKLLERIRKVEETHRDAFFGRDPEEIDRLLS